MKGEIVVDDGVRMIGTVKDMWGDPVEVEVDDELARVYLTVTDEDSSAAVSLDVVRMRELISLMVDAFEMIQGEDD